MPTYRINYLARRHPRLNHEEWVTRWRQHWRLAERQPESATVRRYIQCEVLHEHGSGAHDGVASSEYFSDAARRANRAATDYHRIMREDERQVFDRLIEDCSFIGEHRVLAGSGTGPFKVVRFLARHARISADEFADALAGAHATRVLRSSVELLGYAQNLAVRPDRPTGWGLDVDGSEELWFDRLPAAIAYSHSDALRRLDTEATELFSVAAQVVTNEVILKDIR